MRRLLDWRPCLLALFCLAQPFAPRALAAQDSETAARQISSDLGDAVIAVRVVIKTRVVVEGRQMNEGEAVDQLRATIIDPSGLAVCSLSEVDPSQSLGMGMEEDPGYKFEAELADLKILQPDGSEIPAEVVLRDRDLDLAFIRPSEPPAEPMPAIDLTNGAKPQVLDRVIVLGRLGEVGNRVPSVALDHVQAVVEKPRTLYITGLNTWMAGLGCPVLSLDGQAVGVLVVRSLPGVSSGAGQPRGDSMPVVLPAEDILHAAQQVPAQ